MIGDHLLADAGVVVVDAGGHRLRVWVQGPAGWSSLPWLHRLPQPTLILTGDDDPLIPVVNARIMAARIPNSRLKVIQAGGHHFLLDGTADVLGLVTNFLDSAAA